MTLIDTIAMLILIGVLFGFPIYAINMWTEPHQPRWKRIIGYICGLWTLSWIIGPFILDLTGLVPW